MLPQIQGLAPGSGMAGSWVAVAGANFGASQGSSTVTFGGTSAAVVNWSDNALFVTVPPSLTAGQSVPVVVTTSAGASNAADFLPVSTLGPYRVSPQEVNLLVGQTRTISVTDSSGNAVTGLAWETSNSSVASLSTDDPPIITAVAPGTAMIYVVGMPILVNVYPGASLPAGTSIWSVPMGAANSGSLAIAPAVPSSSGADLFALDAARGTLTALSADGTPVWKAAVNAGFVTYPQNAPPLYYVTTSIIPDFAGGTFLKVYYEYPQANTYYSTHQLQYVSPGGGSLETLYTFSETPTLGVSDAGSTQAIIPHPSGVVFVQDNSTVVLLNPSTGQQVAGVSFADPTLRQTGAMIVAGDGNAYVPYTTLESSVSGMATTDVTHLRLRRFSPDGTNNTINLGDWTATMDCSSSCSSSGNGVSINTPAQVVITNADQGVAVFSTFSSAGTDSLQMTLVSNDAVTSQVNNVFTLGSGGAAPAGVGFAPVLQREDGSYIGADASGGLFAIGINGGLLWQEQITSPPPGSTAPPAVHPLYATADGGAIVTSTQPNCPPGDISESPIGWWCQEYWEPLPWEPGYGQLGTLYTLDQNGNVTAQAPDTGAVYSWAQQAYTTTPGGVSQVSTAAPEWETSYQAMSGGNPSSNGAAVGVGEPVEAMPVFGLKFWGPSCSLPDDPAARHQVALSGNALQQYKDLKDGLLSSGALTCKTCSDFFNADPNRASYFTQLKGGVDRQKPWDGVQTNISQYDAGMSDGKNPTDVSVKKRVAVCGLFVPFNGPNGVIPPSGLGTAASQITPPPGGTATDVYINTNPKALKRLTQGTILHESLHNLTGLYDFVPKEWWARYGYQPPYDLKNLLGMESPPGTDPDPNHGTDDITTKLEGQGCAKSN